jgi:hypothetical protein
MSAAKLVATSRTRFTTGMEEMGLYPRHSILATIAGCPISRSFFARCGIPQASPSSLSRVPHWRMRATVALDDELLRKAQQLSDVSGRSALLREALKALIHLAPLPATLPRISTHSPARGRWTREQPLRYVWRNWTATDRQVWSSKTTISSRGKSTAPRRPVIRIFAGLVRDCLLSVAHT